MLNFYGKDKDPFRSPADVSIPLIEGRVRSVRADLGGKLLQQTIEGELYKHFEVDSRTNKWYLDEDGDLVILDDLDSYQIAYGFAHKTGKGLKVIVDAAKKEANLAAESGIPEMSRPHSTRTVSESSFTVSEFSAMEEPPAWLEAAMEKMRGELKAELMETLSGHHSSGSSARTGSVMRSGHDSFALPHDCDLCCQPIADVRYFCLNKCGSVLCPTCVQNVGHDEDHVLLRLTPNYRGKPKRLVSQAELVLRGLRVAPTSSSSSHGNYSTGLLNVQSIANEAGMRAKKETAQAVVPDVTQEVERKTAEEVVVRAEANEEATNADFNAVIDQESKTGLMNDLGGGVGAYWKQWTIRNIGAANWRDVKLFSTDVSSDKLQPFAPAATIPALEPGQRTDLMVWMYGPVSEPGVYRAHWRLRTAQGVEFGPELLFDFTIGDQETREGTATPEDDDYSIVATVDDPDFELVSDVASTLSFSPSIVQSGRSTPADNDDVQQAHSEQVNVEPVKDDEEELATAAASLVSSLEFAHANETVSSMVASTVNSGTACSFDSPLLDQSLIIESPSLSVAGEVGGSNATNPPPPIVQDASAQPDSVPVSQPTEHRDQSPYRMPERRDVSMNGVLVEAVKVASKAVDKARDVAERAVGKAQQWTPGARPRWQPSPMAWTPRATQTDWSAPDDWTAPQPWQPSAPQNTAPPAEESIPYDAHKMESLVDMGFNDIDRNAQLLRQLNGDMDAVVDTLLQNMRSNP